MSVDDSAPLDDPRLAAYTHVGDAAWLQHHGLFVAEGRLLVERLIGAARFRIESVLLTPPAYRALASRLDLDATRILIRSQAMLDQVTGVNFHRGCLALAHRPTAAAPDVWLSGDGVVLGLDGVGNPDNVGGLFRTAAAFGARGLLVGPTSGDPLYRKAVRTSMGAVLQVPWTRPERWLETLQSLRARGYRVAALTPSPDAVRIEVFAAQRHRRVALLLGAEGPGLSAATLAAADERIRIPISSGVDSLNVMVAAGIALHALNPEP